ncbi:peptide MFS transporter [Sphingopyxis fribergensis]
MSVSVRGHAPGAYLLVLTEMVERFSYYGMRGLLILFMTATLARGGLGWNAAEALAFYGTFTSLIWMSPVIGGWASDRWIGQRRAVWIGGLLMAAGHFALVGATFAPQILNWAVGLDPGHIFLADGIAMGGPSLGSGDVDRLAEQALRAGAAAPADVRQGLIAVSAFFLGGLGLIVIGNGLLKPNITIMLGALYAPDDPRRETAFTLFYVGISIGAFLAALGAGSAGELIGWRYGFALCGLVLVGGMIVYKLLAARFLGPVGTTTAAAQPASVDDTVPAGRPILFIAILSVFAIVFWVGYEQSGGLLNLYTYERVDRDMWGFEIPATWLLSLISVFTILFGVSVAAILYRISARGIALDPPRRFAIGLLVGAAAFATLGLAMKANAAPGDLLPMGWIILFYFLLMIAELVLSPAGFAMVARYAPANRAGLVMGLWLLSVAVGSWLAGHVGAFGASRPAHVTFIGLALAFALTGGLLLALRGRILRLLP